MAKKRGRKTAGALEAVQSIPERPKPPADLDKRQKQIWTQVTSGLPAEWFSPETLGLLRDYCEHQATFERMSEYINNSALPGEYEEAEGLEPLKVTDLVRLTKAREVESRAAMSLATKMRITQQSTYHPEKTKRPGAGKAPWRNVRSS